MRSHQKGTKTEEREKGANSTHRNEDGFTAEEQGLRMFGGRLSEEELQRFKSHFDRQQIIFITQNKQMQAKVDELTEENNKLKEQLSSSQIKLSNLFKRFHELELQQQESRRIIASLEANLSDARSFISQGEEGQRSIQQALEEREDELRSLREKYQGEAQSRSIIDGLKEENQDLRSQLSFSRQQVSDQLHRSSLQQTEFQRIVSLNDSLQRQLEELQIEADRLRHTRVCVSLSSFLLFRV